MRLSNVTDYMIYYLRKNNISAKQIAGELGIAEEKITDGYEEPLYADEFLELCFRLQLRPEDIAAAIRVSE